MCRPLIRTRSVWWSGVVVVIHDRARIIISGRTAGGRARARYSGVEVPYVYNVWTRLVQRYAGAMEIRRWSERKAEIAAWVAVAAVRPARQGVPLQTNRSPGGMASRRSSGTLVLLAVALSLLSRLPPIPVILTSHCTTLSISLLLPPSEPSTSTGALEFHALLHFTSSSGPAAAATLPLLSSLIDC